MTLTKNKLGIALLGVRPLIAVRRLPSFLLLFILLSLFISCSDEDAISTDLGFNYFPLRTGISWIYTIEEITIINQNITETNNYELLVTVRDSVKNSLGGYTYTLQRDKRISDYTPWESFETWTVEINGNKLIQNESNVLFVKQIFPLGEGVRWNGNAFNNLPNNGNLFNDSNSELYNVNQFDKPISISTGQDFNQSLVVVHNDFDDPIVGKDVRREIYARDVGLVYKEIDQLEYCTTPGCLGQQKVDKGVIYKQTLKAHASQ